MNSLQKYIKLCLETRAFTYQPDDINAKLQNELSPKLFNDKTNMTPSEVVDDLSDKWGENYAISFVRGYKGNIPSVEVNPHARFATPHGTYSYLLTRKNFTDLFLKGKLPGDDFATDRPYFHIIKFSSPRKATINTDMSSDFYNKETNFDVDNNSEYYDHLNQEKYKKFTFPKYKSDVREMLRVSLYSQTLPRKIRNTIRQRGKLVTVTRKNYMSVLYATGFRASSVAKNIKLIHDMLCVGSEENLQYLDTFLDYVTSFLINLADRLFTSRKSKYYKRNVEKDMPEFLVAKLYRIADILSYITPNPKTGSGRHNDSSRMSLLLHSVGIETIIDKGSSMIHHKQPQQALSINWGPNSAIENMGTYNNIFKYCTKKELQDLYVKNADYLH